MGCGCLLAGGAHALDGIVFGAVWTAGGIGCFFLLAWMDQHRIFSGGSGGGRSLGGDDEELSQLDYLSDGRLDGHIGPRDH